MIAPQRRQELQELLNSLGIGESLIINWQLLDQALTHPTLSATENNDRLEFFGDSVLRLAVSIFLHHNYSNHKVGELAKLRAHLVSDRILATIADRYDLDRFLLMKNSTRRDPKTVQSRLADALEALLAALYLSTNDLNLITSWLNPHLAEFAANLATDPTLGNYKAALQELTQRYWKSLPEYRVKADSQVSSSTAFIAEVWFLDKCWGEGSGSNIKAAQQAAAGVALHKLLPEVEQIANKLLGEI